MATHQRTTRYVEGMDLHKRTLVMTIMDHDGTVVYQNRTHRRTQAWLAKVLAPYRTDITVCAVCAGDRGRVQRAEAGTRTAACAPCAGAPLGGGDLFYVET